MNSIGGTLSDRLAGWMREHPIKSILIIVVISAIIAPQLVGTALLTAISRVEQALVPPMIVGGAFYLVFAALFGLYPFRREVSSPWGCHNNVSY